MALERERQTLVKFAGQFSPEQLLDKMASRTRSIDDLPVRVATALP